MLKRLFQQGRSKRRGEAYVVLYVESLSDARTQPGERCVSAHWGWVGENIGVWSILLVGLQHVSTTPDGMDQLFCAPAIDFVAKVVDIDVDDVGKRVKVLIPDVL